MSKAAAEALANIRTIPDIYALRLEERAAHERLKVARKAAEFELEAELGRLRRFVRARLRSALGFGWSIDVHDTRSRPLRFRREADGKVRDVQENRVDVVVVLREIGGDSEIKFRLDARAEQTVESVLAWVDGLVIRAKTFAGVPAVPAPVPGRRWSADELRQLDATLEGCLYDPAGTSILVAKLAAATGRSKAAVRSALDRRSVSL